MARARPGRRATGATLYVVFTGCMLLIASIALFGKGIALHSWQEAGHSLPVFPHDKEFINLSSTETHSDILEPETLVVYLLSDSDPEYDNNFRFFIQQGLGEDDGCDYIFVLQMVRTSFKRIGDLPKLPPNARYVEHHNGCTWGTIGWVLSSEEVNTEAYKYFIFMNSSVRGPFLPSYVRGSVHWSKLLTQKLRDKVKVVGPTISCEGLPQAANLTDGRWQSNPHVKSNLLITDQVGLSLMRADGHVFACYDNGWDGVLYSELGSSRAVLRAGYNLDALMLRYQGVNWADTRNWDCNSRLSPMGEHWYDGISVHPLEIMFVTMDTVVLRNHWSFGTLAQKYDKWATQQAQGHFEVVSNLWHTDPLPLKAPGIAHMRVVGDACFDYAYYVSKNADLEFLASRKEQLWDHFVTMGQFEGRLWRMLCRKAA